MNNRNNNKGQDGQWYQQKQWTEDAHREFYQELKQLPISEQKEALLTQASVFALHSEQHPSNLKAAESLISYWGRHLADDNEREEVDELMRELHRQAANR